MDHNLLIRKHSQDRREGGRYSRFVKTMRIILPLTALALFAMLLAWPEIDGQIAPEPQEVEVSSKNIKNELVNPRFEGVDNDRNPYTVTADRAVQKDENPALMTLDRPVADMTLKGGEWLAAEADSGLYDQNSRKIELEGEVFVFYDEGYELTTEKLFVDLRNKQVWSDTEISGKGPKGNLQATSMRANAEENRLFFKGPARLVLQTKLSGF